MDVFKKWNEGENLLHANKKTHNQQYDNWILEGFKDLK